MYKNLLFMAHRLVFNLTWILFGTSLRHLLQSRDATRDHAGLSSGTLFSAFSSAFSVAAASDFSSSSATRSCCCFKATANKQNNSYMSFLAFLRTFTSSKQPWAKLWLYKKVGYHALLSPLEKRRCLSLIKLESPWPWIALCQVWLNLTGAGEEEF